MSAHNSKPTGVLGAILGLVGFSSLAGVLVTALVTPALAVTSMTTQSSIGVFENLPDFITIDEQSQQNQIYGVRNGTPVKIAAIYKQNREEATWENVSQFLKDAATDGEDRRFYQHGGVDMPSVVRAAVKNNTESGAGTSGSSTIDMQLVRNILVQQAFAETDPKKLKAQYADAIKPTLDRKLKEMKLAIGLDKRYSKKQVLLGYLNIVGMGGTTYGVQAAAEQYFSTSAKDVTLAQAASLIAIVQQPNAQSLNDPKKYPANKQRRDEILKAMLEEKHITQKQYQEAVNTKIEDEVKLSPPNNGCRAATEAKFACDYVTKIITSQLAEDTPNAAPAVTALGGTPAERKANWEKGGYKIYTSIDLDLEKTAQDSINQWAPPNEARFALGAAADTVEAGTGWIRVMVNNKDFDDAPAVGGQPQDPTHTAVNFSTDFPYGGSTGFPTGSTFKVFDLANWLQNGHGLGDLVDGHGPQTYNYSDFTAPCDPGVLAGAPFKVNNDGGSGGGTMTVKQALIGSVNNAFMNMAESQDLCSIRETAKSMGAHRADFKSDLQLNPTFVLGTNEIAPLTMAAGAATIGAGGLYCAPIIVQKVVDPSGKELPGQAQTCSQALSSEVAAGVVNAMVGSMTSGTSSPGNPRDGIAIGGKTGTSPSAGNDWILGTTTKLATAVWTGNTIGDASLKRFTNPITHANYYSVSRFQVLKTIMKTANTVEAYRGATAFPAASAAMLTGSSTPVPNLVGLTAEQAKSLLVSLKFRYRDGGPQPSSLPAGVVSNSDPAGGSNAAQGQEVTVYTSDGSLATTMPKVVGLQKNAAIAAISTAGFTGSISVQWVQGTPGTPGNMCQVKASDPAEGAAASKTDPVTLTVYGTSSGDYNPGALCP